MLDTWVKTLYCSLLSNKCVANILLNRPVGKNGVS